MNFREWSKFNVAYGRKLVDSAVEGARLGEGKFPKRWFEKNPIDSA